VGYSTGTCAAGSVAGGGGAAARPRLRGLEGHETEDWLRAGEIRERTSHDA